VTLQEILEDEQYTPVFKKFLAQSFSLENYHFWKEVRDFENSVRQRADHIVHKFLETGSINELNILGTIKTATMESIRSGNFELQVFSEVQKEIELLLQSNFYESFLCSQMFLDACNQKTLRSIQE